LMVNSQRRRMPLSCGFRIYPDIGTGRFLGSPSLD
jgi:hypothetical protein